LISSSIRNSRPVIIRGDRIETIRRGSSYHFWDIDGMIESTISYEHRQRYGLVHVDNPDVILNELELCLEIIKDETLHHYNWGYIGGMNGYYNAGVFGAGSMVANSDGTPANGNSEFEGTIIWPNIHRPQQAFPGAGLPQIDPDTTF
jgi:hypothetical protein